jgi:hypothetical protein
VHFEPVAGWRRILCCHLLLLNRSSKRNLGNDLLGSITRSVLAEPAGKPILVV